MIDIVGAQDGADQLLEKVGLFVGALGGAETRERAGPVLLLDVAQPPRDEVEGFIPARFAERGAGCRVCRGRWGVRRKRLLRIVLRPAEERGSQTLRVRGVIPAVAALDA